MGEPSNDRHQLGRLQAQGEARDDRIEDLRATARAHEDRLDAHERRLDARDARGENLKGAAKAVAVVAACVAALTALGRTVWETLVSLVHFGEG